MSYQGYRANQRGETAEQLIERIAPAQTVRAIIADATASHVQTLDTTAKKIGQEIKSKVTTSQIRGIFSLVREIEQETITASDTDLLDKTVIRRLATLRPKLAYQVGRIDGYDNNPKKAQMGALTTTLTTAIDTVLEANTVLAFRNFVDFFEAIIAYHKYYGGSDKARN